MPGDDRLSRREFIGRAAKAGACLLAAGAVAYSTHDPDGPAPAAAGPQASALPDFAVPAAGRRMCIARGEDRVRNLRAGLQGVGGIEAFVRRGDRVVLKVNAAFASPPMLSATTHPDVVYELARLCFAAGATSVVVTDNPINDPASCFALSGIGEAARRAGAELVLPEERLFRNMTVKDARLIRNWPVLLGALAGRHPADRPGAGQGPPPQRRQHEHEELVRAPGRQPQRLPPGHPDAHRRTRAMVRPTLVVLDGTSTMMTQRPDGRLARRT